MIKIGEKFGQFLIKAEIGRGGMGTIFHAVDSMLNREVALKIIHPQFADNTQLMERFKVEAMTQARMNHHNIVMIYSFIKVENDYVIVMEYVHGRSLKEILRESRILALKDAVGYTRQILDGLKYSHAHNVIHRDIKPANILISSDRQVKISDFGIAKVFGTEGLTKTGILVGTPWYTSPEQILGREIDFRADLYSLGVTFYEMVTGRVPFESPSNSEFQVQKAHLELSPPRPSQYNPQISPELERFILKSLQKRNEKRFQNAQEMQDAIASLDPEKVVIAETMPGLKRRFEEKPARKKFFSPLRVLGLSILFLAGLLLAGFLSGIFKSPEKNGAGTKVTLTTGAGEKAGSGEGKTEGGSGAPSSVSTEPLREALGGETQGKTSAASQGIPGSLNIEKKPAEQTQAAAKEKEQPGDASRTAGKKTEAGVAQSEKGETAKKGEPGKILPVDKTVSPPTVLNIEAAVKHIRDQIRDNQIEAAETEAEAYLQAQADPRMQAWLGVVKFKMDKYTEAGEYWRQSLAAGQWIEMQVAHPHDDGTNCMGTLRFKKGMILYNAERALHSFQITAGTSPGVNKPRKAGIAFEWQTAEGKKSETLILQDVRNRDNKEKFLVDFIQNNIL